MQNKRPAVLQELDHIHEEVVATIWLLVGASLTIPAILIAILLLQH